VQWRVRSSPPSFPDHFVGRPRLIDSITAGLSTPASALAVLSAPAGYGKTTVLSQWMAAALADGRSVGWCSLDRDDRDPAVFWESVLAVLEATAAAGQHAIDFELPQAPSAGGFEPRQRRHFLSGIRRALEQFDDQTTVVFDDTHRLSGSASEDEFLELLGLCPPNVHIALATRTPLPDHRARLARRVWEIDAQALLFTHSETVELFDRFAIDPALVGEVFAASEGWPAVLGLALPGLAASIPHTTARDLLDPDAIYEYFDREIFTQLDWNDRPTLLACAIAPVICADLANTILAREGSALSLRRLSRNNPMLRRGSVDSGGRAWFRVNPLFGGFLREKLQSSQPELVHEGTERAVRWQLSHGDPRAALHLAAQAGEPGLLHSVLRRVGCEIVADGHSADLLALGSISAPAVLSDAFSRLVLALAAVSSGKVDRAQETLSGATSDGLRDEDALEWDWLRYVVAVRIALALGEPVRSISSGWTDETIGILPPSLRAAVHLTRGLAQGRDGELSSAREELEASRATAESSNDLAGEVTSTVGLASIALGLTNVRESVQHAERAVALAGTPHEHDLSSVLTAAHSIAAWGRFQMVDVAAARSAADAALRFAAQQPLEELALQARHVHQFVAFDDLPDRRRAAQDFVAAWPPSYLRHAPPSLVVPSLHMGLGMARVLAEPRWTERLLDRARSVLGDGYDWEVACALVQYSMGRSSSARAILTPLLDNTLRTRTATSEIIAWSLESTLEHQSGNPFRAHEAVTRALQRADHTGAFAEVLRSDPAVVRAVLERGNGRFGDQSRIAEHLVASARGSAEPGVGRLTPKERELLFELKSLRTVAEISSDMLLSVNTVKTHMRGIYRKLNVSSRRRAVSEAERRGLI
jgi:LuxR family maltose regulon positive regulatory protein